MLEKAAKPLFVILKCSFTFLFSDRRFKIFPFIPNTCKRPLSLSVCVISGSVIVQYNLCIQTTHLNIIADPIVQ